MEFHDKIGNRTFKIKKDVVGDFFIIRTYIREDGSNLYKFGSVYLEKTSTEEYIIGFNSMAEFIKFMKSILDVAEILMKDNE